MIYADWSHIVKCADKHADNLLGENSTGIV